MCVVLAVLFFYMRKPHPDHTRSRGVRGCASTDRGGGRGGGGEGAGGGGGTSAIKARAPNSRGRCARTRSAQARATSDGGTRAPSQPPGANAGRRGGASGGTPNVYTGACA